ncbi:hypothetical protein [Terrisporobacter mayombei]|uniref:Uncharacterized protein n=1 Tax=Terrisporobacter mayombei TaxID=1541 RepID=A0ABY9Q1E4_9FIRM|nr:hypothetical protein [Terrisporobacter mayombei]MCC3867511.1 hypothetical protein [Terrisporobacter mayombei]WMT81773.1 hypothetical protein TEMA_21210 [Terrisporobacter mayombei]
MNKLDVFIKELCGVFSNENQIKEEMKLGQQKHPKAKHINGICNNKIINLPSDFKGYFVIEESYYEQGNHKNTLPHLFLFTLNENNNIVLTSYDIPTDIPKAEFRNDNKNLVMDYKELKISSKFNPMTYTENNGSYGGKSVSKFTEEMEFTLEEKIENNKMYVSEVFRKNGKVTFGFSDPIIYEKIN